MILMTPVQIQPKLETELKLPLFSSAVSCGFPSPADDFVENELDLNLKLVAHPATTFFVRARGDSMINAGIQPGDILVVDRSLEPRNNSIVLACIEGEFTVKKFVRSKKGVFLIPCNERYKPIEVTNVEGFSIEGVVTYTIHSC